MNAPAKLPGYQDRYADALRVMAPYGESEDVLHLRRRLLTSRDLATRALSAPPGRHSAEELALARVLLTLASSFAFRWCSTEQLRDAADTAVRILQVATALQRLEAGDVRRH